MFKKIKEIHDNMLSLQDRLNIFTNGENWCSGLTNKKNKINWLRYARMELVEAIDSFQHKHWKGDAVNPQYSVLNLHNLKIELVDAWHFYMSELIRLSLEKEVEILYDGTFDKIELGEDFIIALEELEFNTHKLERGEITFSSIIKQFWNLSLSIMTIEEFESLYISKNALNIFRQENGYKENTYVKVWLIGDDKIGREDNEFLKDYLKIQGNTKLELNKILAYLGNIYKSIKIKKED